MSPAARVGGGRGDGPTPRSSRLGTPVSMRPSRSDSFPMSRIVDASGRRSRSGGSTPRRARGPWPDRPVREHVAGIAPIRIAHATDAQGVGAALTRSVV